MPLKRAVLPLLDTTEPLRGRRGRGQHGHFRRRGPGRRDNTDVPGHDHGPGRERRVRVRAGADPRTRGDSLLRARHGARARHARGDGGGPGPGTGRRELRGRGTSAWHDRAGWPYFGRRAPAGSWHLLISTVPAGAADRLRRTDAAAGTLSRHAVLDVVYHPWPTGLAAAAERTGAAVIGGFELLLHQAAPAGRADDGPDRSDRRDAPGWPRRTAPAGRSCRKLVPRPDPPPGSRGSPRVTSAGRARRRGCQRATTAGRALRSRMPSGLQQPLGMRYSLQDD